MKFMRTTQLALLFVLCLSPVLDAQDFFSGDWHGTVVISKNSEEVPFRVLINGGEAYNYYCKDGAWKIHKSATRSFVVRKRNALLTWIDQEDLWTETQVFSLSYVNRNTLALTWVRHVNNNLKDVDDETWHRLGYGTLRRLTAPTDKCESIAAPAP